jgi:hypothetical protein
MIDNILIALSFLLIGFALGVVCCAYQDRRRAEKFAKDMFNEMGMTDWDVECIVKEHERRKKAKMND